MPDDVTHSARKFLRKVSVIRNVLALTEEGFTKSVHDPTEGRLIVGLAEIAYASDKTIHIYEDKVKTARETKIITKALRLDPLRLISSGTSSSDRT